VTHKQTSALLPRSQEADAFEKADALNPPCATSPGSGGLPFKRYKGRERGKYDRLTASGERLPAEPCFPSPDSSRHKTLENLSVFRRQTRASFRSRAARALRLFRRLFRFSASVDHQMTPALFAGTFRAFGPFAPLTGGLAVGHAFGGPPS